MQTKEEVMKLKILHWQVPEYKLVPKDLKMEVFLR